MGKKCIDPGVRSNYDISKETNPSVKEKNDEKNLGSCKIQVFDFPSESKFPEERRSWIRSIPLSLKILLIASYKTPLVICVSVKHWPVGFEKIKGPKGRERPRDPPSIFEGVKKSLIPSASPSRRTTKRSLNDVRTHLGDVFPQLSVSDKISHEILARDLSSQECHNASVVSHRSCRYGLLGTIG